LKVQIYLEKYKTFLMHQFIFFCSHFNSLQLVSPPWKLPVTTVLHFTGAKQSNTAKSRHHLFENEINI